MLSSSVFTFKKAKVELSDDSESASDSLIAIHRVQNEFVSPSSSSSAAAAIDVAMRNQTGRISTAHTVAARAADACGVDASESTVERAANVARAAVPVNLVHASTPSRKRSRAIAHSLSPPPLVPAHNVYGSNAPMSLQNSYEIFQQSVRDSLKQSTAMPVANQLSSRAADRAALLVRDLSRARAAHTPTPRLLNNIASPLDDTFLAKMVKQTVADDMTPPHLNPDVERMMRSKLSVSRRRHEEAMLRVPRAGEPACSAGAYCRGKQILCKGGGETLMAFYSENVWQLYQEKLSAGEEATLPKNAGHCLLCLRFDINKYIVNMRAENVALDASSNPILISTHYNLVDVPGEYCLGDMIAPLEHVYEGLLMPVVKPSFRNFERCVDERTGDIYFRQLLPDPANVGVSSSSLVERTASAPPPF